MSEVKRGLHGETIGVDGIEWEPVAGRILRLPLYTKTNIDPFVRDVLVEFDERLSALETTQGGAAT